MPNRGPETSGLLAERIVLIPPAMRVLAAATTIVVLADRQGNFAIAATSGGPVIEVLVRPGDEVKAGAPVAVIEQRLLSVRSQNATAELQHLEANLATLKAAHAKQIEASEEGGSAGSVT